MSHSGRMYMSGKGQLLIVTGVLFVLFLIVFLISIPIHTTAVKDLILFETGERVFGKITEAGVYYHQDKSGRGSQHRLEIVVKYEAEDGKNYQIRLASVGIKIENVTDEWVNSYIGRDWGLIIDGDGHCMSDATDDIYFKDETNATIEYRRNVVTWSRIVKYVSVVISAGCATAFVAIFLLLKKQKKFCTDSGSARADDREGNAAR